MDAKMELKKSYKVKFAAVTGIGCRCKFLYALSSVCISASI